MLNRNLLLAAMAGSKKASPEPEVILPPEFFRCTAVSYGGVGSAQCIDTGIRYNNNCIEVEFEIPSKYISSNLRTGTTSVNHFPQSLFGLVTHYSADMKPSVFINYDYKILYGTNYAQLDTNVTISNNEIHTLTYNYYKSGDAISPEYSALYLDGEVIGDQIQQYSEYNETIKLCIGRYKIRRFKIWSDKNKSELLLDWVPCVRWDIGYAGFFDTVSQTFNQTFRTGIMGWYTGYIPYFDLPNGYKYGSKLQKTSYSGYLPIPYTPNDNSIFVGDYLVPGSRATTAFGIYDGANSNTNVSLGGYYGNRYTTYFGKFKSYSIDATGQTTVYGQFIFKKGTSYATKNGMGITWTVGDQSFTSGRELYLLNCNGYLDESVGGSSVTYQALYGPFVIGEGNELKHLLIPVKDANDNACVYDAVTKQTFYGTNIRVNTFDL